MDERAKVTVVNVEKFVLETSSMKCGNGISRETEDSEILGVSVRRRKVDAAQLMST